MSIDGKNELERFTDKCGYDKVWDAISRWIEREADELDFEGCSPRLDDIVIKFACNLDVTDYSFTYDAVIEAYITCTDIYQDTQTATQWLTVRCSAEVDETLKSFKATNVDIYEGRPKHKSRSAATENFVPIISKEQMDDEASAFLQKHCPEALTKPTRVPIREIAAAIGLNLECGFILSEGFSCFGQISFSDMRMRLFDFKTGEEHALDVKRGTTNKYKRLVWQCNQKYKTKGSISCHTPHLTEAHLQYAFITAFNQVISDKDIFTRIGFISAYKPPQNHSLYAPVSDSRKQKAQLYWTSMLNGNCINSVVLTCGGEPGIRTLIL